MMERLIDSPIPLPPFFVIVHRPHREKGCPTQRTRTDPTGAAVHCTRKGSFLVAEQLGSDQ